MQYYDYLSVKKDKKHKFLNNSSFIPLWSIYWCLNIEIVIFDKIIML